MTDYLHGKEVVLLITHSTDAGLFVYTDKKRTSPTSLGVSPVKNTSSGSVSVGVGLSKVGLMLGVRSESVVTGPVGGGPEGLWPVVGGRVGLWLVGIGRVGR